MFLKTPEDGIRHLRKTPGGKGVIGRAMVQELAPLNFNEALFSARAIEHPWYRCQALASIVEAKISHRDALSILDESLAAAYSQREPNRIASVSRWPLRILTGLNENIARDHALRLVSIIKAESHGLRRLDGLAAIFVAVVSVRDIRELMLTEIHITADRCHGWRTERIMNNVV